MHPLFQIIRELCSRSSETKSRIISSALGICDYKNDRTYTELIGRIDKGNGFSIREQGSRSYTHPYLQPVEKNYSFKFKKDHWTTVAEILCLEELYGKLQEAPPEAIAFHMERQNDFAIWIRNVVGDWWLSEDLDNTKLSEPEQTRAELIKVLGHRIRLLKFNN